MCQEFFKTIATENLVLNCFVVFVGMFSGNQLLALPVQMHFVLVVFEHGLTDKRHLRL